MSEKMIEHEITNGVGIVRLNRPDRLNSFTSEMLAQLHAALDTLEADDSVRCLLLTGNGRGFCAGQDLSDVPPPGGDVGGILEEHYNPLILRLRDLPMPVVCAVNGVAAGAGANLALSCDIVVATASAKFIEPFCNLGLVPDASGTWFLPRLVGHARAMGMSLLGEPVKAEQAAEWGLIWAAIPDEEFADHVTKMTERLAMQATAGLALTKRALLAASDNTLEKQLQLERQMQREAGLSHDYAEGVTAFLEKRKPQFKGK